MDSYWYLLVLKILKHSLHVETVEILPQTIALLSWGLPYSKANVEVNNGCLCLSTYYFESNRFCNYSMCMKFTKFWKRYLRLKKNYAFSKIDFQHQPPPISPSKFHQNIQVGSILQRIIYGAGVGLIFYILSQLDIRYCLVDLTWGRGSRSPP